MTAHVTTTDSLVGTLVAAVEEAGGAAFQDCRGTWQVWWHDEEDARAAAQGSR